jgi:hypothetical protein
MPASLAGVSASGRRSGGSTAQSDQRLERILAAKRDEGSRTRISRPGQDLPKAVDPKIAERRAHRRRDGCTHAKAGAPSASTRRAHALSVGLCIPDTTAHRSRKTTTGGGSRAPKLRQKNPPLRGDRRRVTRDWSPGMKPRCRRELSLLSEPASAPGILEAAGEGRAPGPELIPRQPPSRESSQPVLHSSDADRCSET